MELIIKPKDKWWQFNWKEIWFFRDLFYFLTWRDIKVKYKQTVIGAVWAIFQPLVTMVIFSVFFGQLARIPSDGVPYPIFVYSGLVFWTLFSSGLSHASDSFVSNERIITKVYFPRVILPVSSILTNVVDFILAFVILLVLMFYYHFSVSIWMVFFVPLLLIMTVFSALGIGLLFSSLNVKYRDVRFVLPFFIQLLVFITPVIYPVSIVSEKYRWLLGLNPMAGIIDTARVLILHTHGVDWLLLSISVVCVLFYCALGYLYFRKVERYFADVI